MKRSTLIVSIFMLFGLVVASAVEAGDFDGSKPLLMSIVRVLECTPDGSCHEVPPDSVELPRFLKIDFAKKSIKPADAKDDTLATTIERQEVVDGKLILQGSEDGYENVRDGLGWTIAISGQDGQVVMTASGEQVAFVIFGATLAQ